MPSDDLVIGLYGFTCLCSNGAGVERSLRVPPHSTVVPEHDMLTVHWLRCVATVRSVFGPIGSLRIRRCVSVWMLPIGAGLS